MDLVNRIKTGVVLGAAALALSGCTPRTGINSEPIPVESPAPYIGPDLSGVYDNLMRMGMSTTPADSVLGYIKNSLGGLSEEVLKHYFEVTAEAGLVLGSKGLLKESEYLGQKSVRDGGEVVSGMFDRDYSNAEQNAYLTRYIETLKLRHDTLVNYVRAGIAHPDSLRPGIISLQENIGALEKEVTDQSAYDIPAGSARKIIE